MPMTPLDSPTLDSTRLEPTAQQFTDEGDHERFAHYVRKDTILDSAVNGTPVIALCGKVWVPSRDPSRFPVCPDCRRILDGLPPGGDAGGSN